MHNQRNVFFPEIDERWGPRSPYYGSKLLNYATFPSFALHHLPVRPHRAGSFRGVPRAGSFRGVLPPSRLLQGRRIRAGSFRGAGSEPAPSGTPNQPLRCVLWNRLLAEETSESREPCWDFGVPGVTTVSDKTFFEKYRPFKALHES